jgi:EAL domain-containing protein (putative c-di-GMP-specific phosphodiesterase class I)
MAELSIAVNVSAPQLREPDFVQTVLDIIERTGANPRRLKLELTESLLVDNVEDIIQKMFALKAYGVEFSLDDFGTGYSSLSYLKRLPLNQLKIDQSFVRDVLIDPNDASIAKTIVNLAQSLGLGSSPKAWKPMPSAPSWPMPAAMPTRATSSAGR